MLARFYFLGIVAVCLLAGWEGQGATADSQAFPPPLTSYGEPPNASLVQVLLHRIQAAPSNLVCTLIFFAAIAHTFMAPMFLRLSHYLERRHRRRLAVLGIPRSHGSVGAELLHFFGEIEAVFGIWVVPLLIAISIQHGWQTARNYPQNLNFTEPLFVVVIMTIAASRPILQLSERIMAVAASLGRGTPQAWWLAVMTIGPILGSFITEPAAMTISALLLAEKFYQRGPSTKFAYATLGLLFVNVSVGGTLTQFAAPPVLMVAGKWGWDLPFMFTHFGWKAVAGIVLANAVYFFVFRREFKALGGVRAESNNSESKERVPIWVMAVHILFLGWTVLNSHYPALFIGGFLFYLAFTIATGHHQDELALRPALLVGFFLAGLVVHGGLQGWWIEPVLTRLSEVPLFLGATVLSAFNDNAAITYLASLVPGFSPAFKYAVVAGAVIGGGLTVIANAPNPAGQSILSRHFPDGVSPLGLFLGALFPTILMGLVFMIFR